jgi:cytochrome c oxidase subunit 2
MSGPRRSLLLGAALFLVFAIAATTVEAQPPLTPGQGATEALFYLVLIPAIAIGILVMALVAYAVLKFRVRPGHTAGPVVAKTHDRKLETLWTVIPAIILLVVGIAAFQTLVVTDTVPQNPDVTVCVFAQRWAWGFNTSTGSCPSVASAMQRFPPGDFNVKVGQTVKLVFQSIDVAHSFYIPAFDLKIDVIPGHQNIYWFKALAVGNFEIHCAEFCGLQHYSMVATLHVTSA